ncbi:uncharacterized protein LOC120644805 isoform X2 [Panicum virgatum]|uniref:uncharacterized protein LOC120644805 isoform X2 n=1 Tax=Panicum virgatum TaxID=38727 RepID=UPI0019D618F2|nr:uncharacterized protein LOC120644805 isoform X2 [Panicum virgatum]
MCGWCLIKFRILLEIQRTPPWFLRSRLGDALASRRFSNLGVRPTMPFRPMASLHAVRRCQGVGWTPQEGEGDAHRRKTGAATLRALGKSHAPVHARGKRTGSCARWEIAGIYPTRARRTPLRRREIEKGGKRGKRGREERGGRTCNLAAGGGISGGRSWNLASRPLHSPSSRWFLCSTSARSSAPLLPLLHPPAESRSALARLRLTSAALPLKDSWVVGSWLLSLLHLTSAQSQRGCMLHEQANKGCGKEEDQWYMCSRIGSEKSSRLLSF